MADENLKQMVGKHFNSQAAANIDAIYQLNLKEGDTYYLKINNGAFEIHEGSIPDPSVTLTTDKKTLGGVIDGSVNGMQAFMMGKLKFSGSMSLAMKLKDIFSP